MPAFLILYPAVHFYVDDKSIYQAADISRGVWAVGNYYGSKTVPDASNYNTINIEICVNPDSDYNIARANCIELVKYLMSVTGIPAERVIRHYDAKGKYCPRKMMDNPSLWVDFKAQLNGSTSPVTPVPSGQNVNIYYQVFAGGRWLPVVANLDDYAGIQNVPVTAIAVKVDKGRIKYRVHNSVYGWYDWVWGENYNLCDIISGFAGDYKNPIDAIQAYYYTPDDIRPCKKVQYRVDTTKRVEYFSWQLDTDTDNDQDGYAGLFGEAIDRVQMVIK